MLFLINVTKVGTHILKWIEYYEYNISKFCNNSNIFLYITL